jgi:cytochrome c553
MSRGTLGILAVAAILAGCRVSTSAPDAAPPSNAATRAPEAARVVPDWLFPVMQPVTHATPAAPVVYDQVTLLHVPHSNAAYTEAQLKDLFSAPDWHPEAHAPMPALVLHGRAPDVYACGYCHTPTGQGRPENAALAGLPAAYIVRQVADFRSGARRSAWHGNTYRPNSLMIQLSEHLTDDEVAAAATYFSEQHLHPRVVVKESARVPRTTILGGVYALATQGGDEVLGQRLIEIMPDAERHERRDDTMIYAAYVPSGSIGRGRALATRGAQGLTQACTGCHGADLRGTGQVPSLAGRSPSYVMRQLLAFQTQARSTPAGLPMQAIVAKLTIPDMIDVAAYTASRAP